MPSVTGASEVVRANPTGGETVTAFGIALAGIRLAGYRADENLPVGGGEHFADLA